MPPTRCRPIPAPQCGTGCPIRQELVELELAIQVLLKFGSWHDDGTFVYEPDPGFNAIAEMSAALQLAPSAKARA